MIVTAHQPNYLPSVNVIEKIERADVIVWLDDVQYTRGGFTNRNRMHDGSWLTVPVQHETLGGPIRSVKIDYSRPWTQKHARTLTQHYGSAAAPFVSELERRPSHLIKLNLRLLSLILSAPEPTWYLQTQFAFTGPISDQLARMVSAVGGSRYLSGPSGRRYLDETPFHDRGIFIEYSAPATNTDCVLSRYARGVPAWLTR